MHQLDLFSNSMPSKTAAQPSQTVQKDDDLHLEKSKTEAADGLNDFIDKTEDENRNDNFIVHSLSANEQNHIPAKKVDIISEASSPIFYIEKKIEVGSELTALPATPPAHTIKLPQKRGRKSYKEIDIGADLIEIPDDEELNKKLYYSISEVAKWFRVNTSLLRFWCSEFDILKPRKNRKGDRLFRPEDVKNLQLIHQLLRVRKFSIEGAKDYIKANKQKADVQLQLTQTLQKFKGFLLELKANLHS